MKVHELITEEDVLDELAQVMKLRATASKVSQENAEACYRFLKRENYRWSLETTKDGIRFLHIAMASFKKGWRNSPGRMERSTVRAKLKEFGYKTAPFRGNAVKQEPNPYGGPHIFFW